jgi:hypothetical protein
MTIKIEKIMIRGKVILKFKFTLNKVERSRDPGKYELNEKPALNALWIMFHGLTGLLPSPPL